jgi:hypothetical protein
VGSKATQRGGAASRVYPVSPPPYPPTKRARRGIGGLFALGLTGLGGLAGELDAGAGVERGGALAMASLGAAIATSGAKLSG